MTYQNFIYLIEELKRKSAITMQWGDCNVSFQFEAKNDFWSISSPIAHNSEMVDGIQTFLKNTDRELPAIQFTNNEKKELLFVKNFQRTNRYTLFRQFMKKYLEEAKSWRVAFDPDSPDE